MAEHSPEPWEIRAKDDDGRNTIIGSGDQLVACTKTESGYLSLGGETAEADARRIVACVNFCRQFSTDFLAQRQLVKINSKDDIKSAADIPRFDGFVPAVLIPIQENLDEP